MSSRAKRGICSLSEVGKNCGFFAFALYVQPGDCRRMGIGNKTIPARRLARTARHNPAPHSSRTPLIQRSICQIPYRRNKSGNRPRESTLVGRSVPFGFWPIRFPPSPNSVPISSLCLKRIITTNAPKRNVTSVTRQTVPEVTLHFRFGVRA